eukprot:TRINITY_DN436_c2_g1_i2.p1 TRINITY_DN436_c2_g1~~TRINITY_DN436_c2_g1_i2.p1  ORF type:complete len:523 (+),score=110.07 TRINITY_DN436_c2_g1_i2:159-1571(+)
MAVTTTDDIEEIYLGPVALPAGIATVEIVSQARGSFGARFLVPAMTAQPWDMNVGQKMTISGANLGNGNDITLVEIHQTSAAILNQSTSHVVVAAPAVSSDKIRLLRVSSTSKGDTMSGKIHVSVQEEYQKLKVSSLTPSAIPSVNPTFTINGQNLDGGTNCKAYIGDAELAMTNCNHGSVVYASYTGTLPLGGYSLRYKRHDGTETTFPIYVNSFSASPSVFLSQPGNNYVTMMSTLAQFNGGFGAKSVQVTYCGQSTTFDYRNNGDWRIQIPNAPSSAAILLGDIVVTVDGVSYTAHQACSYLELATMVGVLPKAINKNSNKQTILRLEMAGTDRTPDSISLPQKWYYRYGSKFSTFVMEDAAAGEYNIGVTYANQINSVLVEKAVRLNDVYTTPPMIRNGGGTVTIAGAVLGSGTDITYVSLAGIEATIVAQTNISVTVDAAPYVPVPQAALVTLWLCRPLLEPPLR